LLVNAGEADAIRRALAFTVLVALTALTRFAGGLVEIEQSFEVGDAEEAIVILTRRIII
jgi:hypothetical protein